MRKPKPDPRTDRRPAHSPSARRKDGRTPDRGQAKHDRGGAAADGKAKRPAPEKSESRPFQTGKPFKTGKPTQKQTERSGAKQAHLAGKRTQSGPATSMRIARAMARAGLCSRREAERWIADGRVSVNGHRLDTPACEVGPGDAVLVDGKPLPAAEPPRLWRYHKQKGLVTTHADPEGRPTVFDALPKDLPRVISIGRLDFNTEGLLLLTNDGALARHLELPSTGWLRRYRVRAHGRIAQTDLDALKDGITIDGVRYGPVEATLDTVQGGNVWITLALREGKNREVRRILEQLGLAVNRLIRVSYGPFQLLDLKPGEADAVKKRVLAEQLGKQLADEFGLAAIGEAEDIHANRGDGSERTMNKSRWARGKPRQKIPQNAEMPDEGRKPRRWNKTGDTQKARASTSDTAKDTRKNTVKHKAKRPPRPFRARSEKD